MLQRWVPELLAGHGGALGHGLLRTAHAVRALPAEQPPSELQLAELSRGLAFWAATFTTLPGRPALTGQLTLPEALARLPRPVEKWAPFEAGTFTRMAELDGFARAVEALAAPASNRESLGDLTAAFCRIMLANAVVPAVPLVHTVTPVSAMRTLLPHLPGLPLETMYARLWHVGAAIVCGFTPPTTTAEQSADTDLDIDDDQALPLAELIGQAVEHRDPHVLKFVEACAREHARRPNAVYQLAAQHVIEHIPAW